MNIEEITLLTASFNNNTITRCMLMSAIKQIGYINCIILDNGTKEFCDKSMKEVFTVIDNTNFKHTKNYNQVSKNHCSSIDYALWNCITTKYVILCDNDILFKPTIKNLLESLPADFDAVGEIGFDVIPPERLFPYFCIINVEKMKNQNIHYFDEKRCMRLWDKNGRELFNVNNGAKGLYDTGFSFLEDIKKKNWNCIQIKLSDYILHLKGTYLGKDWKKWLNNNSQLFT